VEDNGDGTYGVTYSVPKAGHYRLRVTTGGINIRGSPWFFSIDGGTRSHAPPPPNPLSA
jgi:hypothetical protein